ncbi:phytoene/squalene synthase family protein [Lysobacter sp. A3-1-A15]|uniref:phytoene/squalene synthase family protein n=1 Tax=Novilysobacter viscosus TaxID=3098602 RepID=UPI002ED83E88
MSEGLDTPASGGAQQALEAFTGKWRQRWPEWTLAEVFLSAPQRPLALAWAALQQELCDAAWGGSDARPGEAKLAWWAEELAGWGRGMRRHPLGAVLQARATAWPTLAASLPTLAASRGRPGDPAEAANALKSFAHAITLVDAELFGSEGPAGPGTEDIRVALACLQQARFQQGDDGHVPSSLGRAWDADARARWAALLLADWPPMHGPRPRRLWATLAHLRLERGDGVSPAPAWRVVWHAWRAARN